MTATVETPYNSLMTQILEKQEKKNAVPQPEANEVPFRQASNSSQEMGGGSEGEGGADGATEAKRKTFSFAKGTQVIDVDEDAEFEFIADKRPVKMTLRQMRDAAAGDVAIRNRMRQLAEEKKAIQDPYKNFSKMAQDDPFRALKKVFSSIQKVDPSANFDEFLSNLGKQAQTVAQMDPSARKAYLAEKELKEVKGQLTEAQQMQNMAQLKEELVAQTGLSDEKIFSYGQQILKDPVLSKMVASEEDLMERIGDLAEEVEMQQASLEALRKHNPKVSPRDPLIFELSNLLKQNPDFDEQDLADIAKEVMVNVGRSQASQRLSKKQRHWTGSRSTDAQPDFSKMKPAEALLYQIQQKKKQQQNIKR